MKQEYNVDGVRRERHVPHPDSVAPHRPPIVHTTTQEMDGLSAKSDKTTSKHLEKKQSKSVLSLPKILFSSLNPIKTHRRLKSLAFVRTVLDWRIYFFALVPFLWLLPKATPNGLLHQLKNHQSTFTTNTSVGVFITLWVILVLSFVAIHIFDGLSYNTALKQIDHRTQTTGSALKLLLNNWPVNLASLLLALASWLVVGLSFGLIGSSIVFSSSASIEALTPLLLYICFVAIVISSSTLWLWRRFSVINTSVTTESFGANVYYTTRLISRNFGQVLGFLLYYGLIGTLFLILVSAVFVVETRSIVSGLSSVTLGLIFALSALCYGIVLWCKRLFSTIYWTSVMYRLVHGSAKSLASHYLAMLRPFRKLGTKLVFLGLFIAVLVVVGSARIVLARPHLQRISDKISHFQNFDVSKLIPAKK